MEIEKKQQVATSRLAQISLTENQVKQAIAEFLVKNEEFKTMTDGKRVLLTTNWQTSKWSSPDSMVICDVLEINEEQSSEVSSN